jgi:hypothetical protein
MPLPFGRTHNVLIAVLTLVSRVEGADIRGALPLPDSTRELQSVIDSIPPDGVVDCRGKHYRVSALFLHPRMTIQNCWFDSVPGTLDLVSPITIDGRVAPVSGVTIRNVHVYGNRHEQTAIGISGEENGGRHCFRLLGVVSDVLIEDSSGTHCASDGIALVSYGLSATDDPSQLPFQRIVIRNSDFSFNRRDGASADGAHALTFDRVTFTYNGTSLPGGAEGDGCVTSGGLCFGTGFWYEDYRTGTAGEGLDDITFVGCVFRQNYQRSMFFFSRERQSAPGFQPRGGVRILNSYLDSGQQPLAEDYAIQFQVDDGLVGQGAVFQDVNIENSTLKGSVGLRQVSQFTVSTSQVQTTLPYLGYSAYSSDLILRNVHPPAKPIAASLNPEGGDTVSVIYIDAAMSNQTYGSTPPNTGFQARGDIIWNTVSGSGFTGWICLAGGTPCAQWQGF